MSYFPCSRTPELPTLVQLAPERVLHNRQPFRKSLAPGLRVVGYLFGARLTVESMHGPGCRGDTIIAWLIRVVCSSDGAGFLPRGSDEIGRPQSVAVEAKRRTGRAQPCFGVPHGPARYAGLHVSGCRLPDRKGTRRRPGCCRSKHHACRLPEAFMADLDSHDGGPQALPLGRCPSLILRLSLWRIIANLLAGEARHSRLALQPVACESGLRSQSKVAMLGQLSASRPAGRLRSVVHRDLLHIHRSVIVAGPSGHHSGRAYVQDGARQIDRSHRFCPAPGMGPNLRHPSRKIDSPRFRLFLFPVKVDVGFVSGGASLTINGKRDAFKVEKFWRAGLANRGRTSLPKSYQVGAAQACRLRPQPTERRTPTRSDLLEWASAPSPWKPPRPRRISGKVPSVVICDPGASPRRDGGRHKVLVP